MKFDDVKKQILETYMPKYNLYLLNSKEFANILNNWNNLSDLDKDMILRMLHS